MIDRAMHVPAPKLLRYPFAIALALALMPSGCFNPLVMLESEDGGSEGDTTDAMMSDGGSTDAMTTVDPDSDSGDPPPVCGDGVVEGDEVCDDGVNDGSYGGCTADCTAPGPFCGDGVLNGEEPCDDGDEVDGNGCNVDCVVSGSVLWTVTVDGPDHGTDVAAAVAVDSADNVVVVGKLTIEGHDSVWVSKYTPNGEEVWSKTYCPTGGDCYTHDIAVTPDDGIIVAGVVDDGINGQDAWIRRYSSVGDAVWTQTYDGPTGGSDAAQAVLTDENGSIYVLVRQDLVEIGNGIVDFVRKYTADGEELWTIYQPTGIRVNGIAMLPTGSLILVGQEGNSDYWTPWMQEMSSDGGTVWEATHDDHAPGWYYAVDASNTGNLALSLSLQGQNNFLILRMTADGQETWSETPWGFNSSTQSVTLDDAGWLTCTGGSGQDITLWTRKYQPDGTIAWTDTYNGPEAFFGLDQGQDITRDHTGHPVAVGMIQDTEKNETDAWIRKYAP